MDQPTTPAGSRPVPPPPSGGRWFRCLTGPGAVVTVLVAFWVLLVAARWNKSMTYDELGTVTAGYTYWRYNDYRFDPENGNLPQRVAALPLLGHRYAFPPRSDQAWERSDVWDLGFQWLYRLGNDAQAMVRRGRAVSALFAVALGALVWFWSRRLHGPIGGMLSLLMFVLSPIVLANGALMTTDTAVSLFFLASVGCVWGVLHRLTPGRVLLSALVMGALFVSKMSAPLIVPMALVLVAARLIDGRPLPVAAGRWQRTISARGRQVLALAAATAVHGVVVFGVIWTVYGFRYSAMARNLTGNDHLVYRWGVLLDRPDPLTLLQRLSLSPAQQAAVQDMTSPLSLQTGRWTTARLQTFDTIRRRILTSSQVRTIDAELAAPPRGGPERLVGFLRRHHVLPEAYLYGLCYMLKFSHLRNAFLNGQVSLTGWWWFFPYTFLVKTPLTVFGVILLAFAAAVARRRAARRPISLLHETLPWWTLLVAYSAAVMLGHLNIGQRHLMPAYAPMFVLCGGAAWWVRRWRNEESSFRSGRGRRAAGLASLALAGLVVAQGANLARQFPDYIAYFNPLAGGPAQGYRHLVDSSLDWGQDLPGLARYLSRHRVTGPIYLSYFGTASPDYYLPRKFHVRYLYSNAGNDVVPSLFTVTVPADRVAAARAALLRAHPDYWAAEERPAGAGRVEIVMLEKPAALRPTGGTYFISASMLQPVMYPLQGPVGPWNKRYEGVYQGLRAWVRPLMSDDPAVRLAALDQHPLSEWEITLRYYDMCLFARLTAWLRQRRPDGEVNYSILIYHLTDQDLHRALDGPPAELGIDLPRESLPKPAKGHGIRRGS